MPGHTPAHRPRCLGCIHWQEVAKPLPVATQQTLANLYSQSRPSKRSARHFPDAAWGLAASWIKSRRQPNPLEPTEAQQRPDERFLTDLRFHDLRHEATSRLASIFPMHELTKITGHKDPRMLMRYYHPRAEDLAKRLG